MSEIQTYIAQPIFFDPLYGYSGSYVFYFTASGYTIPEEFTVSINNIPASLDIDYNITPINGDTRQGALIFPTIFVSASLPVTISRNDLEQNAPQYNAGSTAVYGSNFISFNNNVILDFNSLSANITASYVLPPPILLVSSSMSASDASNNIILSDASNNDVILHFTPSPDNQQFIIKQITGSFSTILTGSMFDNSSSITLNIYDNQRLLSYNGQYLILT
jgi:hypothetical protein